MAAVAGEVVAEAHWYNLSVEHKHGIARQYISVRLPMNAASPTLNDHAY